MAAVVGLALVYGLVAGLFVWRVVLDPSASPDALGVGDLLGLYYPTMVFGFDRLRMGALPLWNPYQACGTPLLADPQIGLLYPLYAPFWFLPVDVALDLDVALHLTIAALSTFVLCRHLGQGMVGAALAGLIYAFQGSLLARLHYPSHLAAVAWLPLVVALVDRVLLAPSRGRVAALGAVLAVWLLGGYLQYVYFTVLALLPLVAVRSWDTWRAGGAAALARAWGGVCLGALLALLASLGRLIPGIEFMRQSWRPLGGLPIDMAAVMSMSPAMFVRGLLTPGVLQPAEPLWRTYPLRESYLGLLPLVLAGIGLVTWRPRRVALAIAAAGVGAALYAFGPSAPFYTAIFALPAGAWFRGPSRALVVFGLATAVLAGAGLSVVERLARSRLRVGGAALAVAAVLAAAVLLADMLSAPWHGGAMPSRLAGSEAPDALAFQLVRARQGLERTYVWADWARKRPLGFIRSVAKAGLVHGVYQVTDYAVSGERFERYLDALGPRVAFPLGYRVFEVTPQNLPLLRLLGTRYLIGTRRDLERRVAPEVRREWRELARDGEVVVLEDPGAFPRAFLVEHVRVARDGEQALADLRRIDLTRTAVVEGDAAALSSLAEGTDVRPAPGKAEIVRYTPEAVTIHVQTSRPALLVLTDQWNAGWRATIDGTPARVYRADYLFRGVVVGPGAHQVALTYAPYSVSMGLWGSALGFVLIAGLAWSGRRPRRRRA